MTEPEELGTGNIGNLVIRKAIPISVGILAVSLYFLADTIFVGHFVGALGISAVTVVLPIIMLISSIGTAIGVGGSSVISRLLGQQAHGEVNKVFGSMVALNLSVTVAIVLTGTFFEEQMLFLFGANGDIMPLAQDYFRIVLPGVPFMAFDIMVNYVMNSEGRSKAAMLTMMIPAIVNVVLDAVFVIGFDWGIKGAAWATTIAYMMSACYSVWFFFFRHSEVKLIGSTIRLEYSMLKKIIPLGMVSLARNGSSSVLIVILNHVLFYHGDELAVAMYGILNRFQLFIVFPLAGIIQSFSTVVGFNYGAGNWTRVKSAIYVSIRYGTLVTIALFAIVMLFPHHLVHIFTTTPELVAHTPGAMRLYFMAMPILAVQLIGSTYFRAIDKPVTALYLTLILDFLIIPLVLILPLFFDLNGVWIAFAFANLLATLIVYWNLRREIQKDLNKKIALAKESH